MDEQLNLFDMLDKVSQWRQNAGCPLSDEDSAYVHFMYWGYFYLPKRVRNRLTEDQVAAIRQQHENGQTVTELASAFGVKAWMIENVIERFWTL